MPKKSKKSKSKRISLKQKHKVIRKVKEHHKKKAKEAKKLGLTHKKKVEKDPGIPNDWPFKEQELKALEERRARALEELEQKKAARKEKAQKRKLGLIDNDVDPAKLASAASAKGDQFEIRKTEDNELAMPKNQDHSERTFYKELKKVIEASDVILEVLDARDPIGTRCIDMEKMIYESDPNKKLVLLLNKIDLVPREAVEKWLKYFRGELPAVAFKCSTQQQRSNLGWKSSSKTSKTSNMQTSDCLGADTLLKLLKNYSRSSEIKVSITVGIIGLPNVGKSSLINSLKRSHVVNVGATPGLTRSMQEIHLDKHVKLLDCPGVVMLKSSESSDSIALRNCKRIEKLDDPVGPVKEILKLCPAERLIPLYKISSYGNVDEFLQKVAEIRGKLKKGGILDIEAAARIVLHDWNEGKIPYYTLPPVKDDVDLETTIVSQFSKEFDIDEVYKTESSFIGSLVSAEEFRHVEVPNSTPLNFDEQMLVEDNPDEKEANQTDEPMNTDEKEDSVVQTKTKANKSQLDKLYNVEGMLDPRKRKAEKKRIKKNKLNLTNQMDADYDFKVDFSMKDANEADDGDDDDDGGDDDGEHMTGVEMDA